MKNWRSITGEINGAAPRGFLRWTGPVDRRVRKFDGLSGRRLRIAYGAAERPGFRRFKGFGLPLAGWFRGWRIALRAMLIKSALRINLSASYVTKSITSISHLRWLSPLWCLTPPKGECISSPAGRLYGFRCQRQRHIKFPSEPARSVG